MTADFFLSLAQAITKGLLTGMVYGLMALGLSVIFGVMRVVNFAHGAIMVVGMYLAWMGFEYLQVSPMLSLPVIAAMFFVAGYALQRMVISPFIGSSCCCWRSPSCWSTPSWPSPAPTHAGYRWIRNSSPTNLAPSSSMPSACMPP